MIVFVYLYIFIRDDFMCDSKDRKKDMLEDIIFAKHDKP